MTMSRKSENARTPAFFMAFEAFWHGFGMVLDPKRCEEGIEDRLTEGVEEVHQ